MIVYEVKSVTALYPLFQIEDDGLGYLDFNIFKRLGFVFYGPVGEFLGCPHDYPTSDIRVRKLGTKRWRQIRYKPNSSEWFLA